MRRCSVCWEEGFDIAPDVQKTVVELGTSSITMDGVVIQMVNGIILRSRVYEIEVHDL